MSSSIAHSLQVFRRLAMTITGSAVIRLLTQLKSAMFAELTLTMTERYC
jgi:hypothetical protein